MIKQVCPICKKEFISFPSQKKKTCGIKCARIFSGANRRGSNHHYYGKKRDPKTVEKMRLSRIGKGMGKRGSKYKELEVTCQYCGKPMKVTEGRLKDGRGKHCSKSCLYGSKRTGDTKRDCRVCGKQFFATKKMIENSVASFCSKKCREESRIKKSNKEDLRVNCEICGKSIKVFPSEVNKRRFCSFRCRNVWLITCFRKSGCKDTSIELAIEKELRKTSMKYRKQAPIKGVGVVDFLVHKNLIIECDGDYWHNLPGRKIKDFNRDFRAGFLGYLTVRFTEGEIKKNPLQCLSVALMKYICFLSGDEPNKYDWEEIKEED